MAKNIIFNLGDHISLPVPAGTKSGDPVRVGGLNGVAVTDRAKTDVVAFNADGQPNATYNAGGGNPNGNASVWLTGAARLDVKGTGINPGDPIYFDAAATPKLTKTNSGALPEFGHAIAAGVASGAAGNESVTVRIKN